MQPSLAGMQELLGERLPPPLPARGAGAYAGRYVAGEDEIVVAAREGGLAIVGRGMTGRLAHAGDHRFRVPGVRGVLTFVFTGPGPAGFLRGPEFVAVRAQAPRRK